MAIQHRRNFLKQALTTGAAAAAGPWLAGIGQSQTPSATTRVAVNSERKLADLDRRLFGSFLEHLGRAVYEGVYDPDSPRADAKGFRKDVAEEIKKLGVPIMRYPGGNFVSGYNWLHGVGPKSERPTVLDRAWNSIETNQFGTNEFLDWCKLVGTEPLLATNLGTGTPETSAALVEYCNVAGGTRWSDLRREHGYSAPHNVKTWCIGNEMDGPWQIGHMTAREYGRKARDAAQQMRYVDRSLQLIACGSSNNTMETYMTWDREVLEECYDQADAISLHGYYGNTESQTGGHASHYVALNLDMERQIGDIIAVCDYVRGLTRSRKQLWLSFDEWNVWYRARGGRFTNGNKTAAPHLLEEVYNLEDALLVGGFVNTLLRQAARVRVACLAQIVNVIAPLMTDAEKTIRQTTYYPYAWALEHARGDVLDLLVDSPTYEIDRRGYLPQRGGRRQLAQEQTPYVDVSGTIDGASNECALFLLNRDLENEREVETTWRGATPRRVIAARTLTGSDLKAANTLARPNTVTPQDLDAPAAGDSMTFKLPAASFSVVRLAIS